MTLTLMGVLSVFPSEGTTAHRGRVLSEVLVGCLPYIVRLNRLGSPSRNSRWPRLEPYLLCHYPKRRDEKTLVAFVFFI